jgi:hypothetical protein
MTILNPSNRDTVKWIRDRAKSKYQKGTECYICRVKENLDFHHYYSLSPLLHRWMKANRRKPEDVIEFRDEFIELHKAELYDHAVTLCHTHHQGLHSIYGKDPGLGTAKKQERWVSIQREKYEI